MKNFNIDAIQKVLEQKGILKIAKTRVTALMLAAATTLSVGTISASAAEVKFDSITITSEGYVKEQDYTSSYLSTSEKRSVSNMMKDIDADYQAFYNLMANGVFYGIDTNACMARLIATNNEFKNRYENQMKNNSFGSNAKTAINKYLETKEAEAKALFTSVTNISADQIKDYTKNYDCTFATILNGNNNATVAVYKKGNSYAERTISYNDSTLSNSQAMVKIPTLEIYTSNYENKVTANTKYQAVIVSNANVAMINQIIEEANTLYDKVAKALTSGNYTKKSNGTIDDVYVALNGDLNLISSSLEAKYASYAEAMNTVRLYMAYRNQELTVQAYNKNKNHASYADFVNYAAMNTPIRSYEENGYVYYNLGNYSASLYRVKDNGYVKTKELSATGTVISNPNPVIPSYPNNVVNGTFGATVHVGINMYYNDYRFIPVDANGNQVYPFVYEGTTYLPVRAVAGLCNYGVEWDQATNRVLLTRGNGYNIPQTSYETSVTKSQLTETYITGTTNVRVFIDGIELIPRDANGKVVPIINWNGTTYLPVRALANQVGLAVTYDSANNVVFLGQHYTYSQPTTPITPSYPTTPSYPSTGTTISTSREYIYGTKDGVQYKIYFDDNGFYLYDGVNFVPTDVTQYEFEEVKTR